MVFAWKAAGLTYNRYLAIAGRAVRRSLKEESRVAAERRGQVDVRFSKWEGEPKNLADAPVAATESASA